MSKQIETEVRCLKASELRVAGGAGDDMQIEGYAALFNSQSNDLGGGLREQIAPTAFARTLRERDPESPDFDGEDDDDVKALRDHDRAQLLGRTANGSLQLSCDQKGLRFRCKLNPEIQLHRDVHAAVKSGLMDTCSFAFRCADGGERYDDRVAADGSSTYVLRTLTDIDLFDVSILGVKPAYPGTSVSARALEHAKRGLSKKPYTQSEIQAIKEKLLTKVNSTVAKLENGQDVDDERALPLRVVGTEVIEGETPDEKLHREQAEDIARRQRAERVGESVKHGTVQEWLKPKQYNS